jgi:hypothetical protein
MPSKQQNRQLSFRQRLRQLLADAASSLRLRSNCSASDGNVHLQSRLVRELPLSVSCRMSSELDTNTSDSGTISLLQSPNPSSAEQTFGLSSNTSIGSESVEGTLQSQRHRRDNLLHRSFLTAEDRARLFRRAVQTDMGIRLYHDWFLERYQRLGPIDVTIPARRGTLSIPRARARRTHGA